jgi:Ala-tRNA(Pro) deacylase
MARLTGLPGGRSAALAPRQVARALTGVRERLDPAFLVPPRVASHRRPRSARAQKLFFNAARLDRSVALAADDYIALARPRIEQIGDL